MEETVFVADASDYDNRSVVGVFTTVERAKEALERYADGLRRFGEKDLTWRQHDDGLWSAIGQVMDYGMEAVVLDRMPSLVLAPSEVPAS